MQRQTVASLRRLIGKEPEILGAARRGCPHKADRLAAVHTFHQGDLLGALFDQLGKAVKDFPALLSGGTGPRGEGLPGCPAGMVYISGRTFGDKSNRRIIRRRQVFKGMARNATTGFAVHVMRGDVILETF